MAVFQDALQHALTQLREGRLRLDELCSVMALYGARTLHNEPPADPHQASVELIERLISDVLQGSNSQLLVASELISYAEFSAQHLATLTGARPGSELDGFAQLDTDPGPSPFASGERGSTGYTGQRRALHTEPTKLLPKDGKPSFRTRLNQLYTQLDIQPTVAPGIDSDAPGIDDAGTTQYALGKLIGEGGSGRVLLAVDRDLRRSVAIKTLREDQRQNPLALRAFIEEAIITGGLEHPNIVPVYQLGYSDTLGPYYVMKRLEGMTLSQVLQGLRRRDPEIEQRFDLDRLLTIFIEICQGLLYSHDRRVIHCDLKPNNILIGHYGEVMVVDWGLALVLGEEGAQQARAEFWSGTPGFMAPEQILGDHSQYDVRTDIWALGGILYAMLSLSKPFPGRNKEEILDAVLHGEPVAPSLKNPSRQIPEGLERIALKALARAPEDRYPSVLSLMSDVEEQLAGRRRLRQRIELGQRTLEQCRELIDPIETYEALCDALQSKIMNTEGSTVRYREELHIIRERLIPVYSELTLLGTDALNAGAHHPPLEDLLGSLYWGIFKRLYPARVPAHRALQQEATELLRKLARTALPAIVRQSHGLQFGDRSELPESLQHDEGQSDPWLDAVLAYCGPDANAPDADTTGVASQLGHRLAFLRQIPIFREVPGIDLLTIAEACERRVFKANTPIFREGDYGDALYMIAEGHVNLVRGRAVLSTIGPTRCLGEIALIDGAPRTASAVCAGDVVVYRLSSERFRTILADNGSVAMGLMRVLADRLRDSTSREETLRQHLRR